ncbi:unnamed protein product [Alopecurus aequalis]
MRARPSRRVNEGDDSVEHVLSLVAVGLEEVEDVALPLRLQQLDTLPIATPRCGHRLRVRSAAPPEVVPLRHAHHDLLARQRLQTRRAGRHGVHSRVVHAARAWACEHPEPPAHGARHRVSRLLADGFGAPEPGVDQHRALDARGVRLDCEVVADVGAGAVPGHEDSAQVPVRGDPGVGAREHPPEGGDAVVIGCWERVLWCETVLDGDADGGAGRGEAVEEAVAVGGRDGLRHEAAPVDVNDDRQLGCCCDRGRGQVKAGGVVAEVDVLGVDAGGGIKARRGGRSHEGSHDAAALEDTEEPELVRHLVVVRNWRPGIFLGVST